MKKLILAAGMLGLVAFMAVGCAKKAEPVAATPPPTQAQPAPKLPKPLAVEVVAERERSRHFEAVSRQLELGGTLYGYVDVDGDVLKIAGSLQTILGQMAETQPRPSPFWQQDFAALFNDLGLTDIKAAGASSVPDGTGYFRNRVYFHIPGERRGLLRGLGDKPAPFARTGLAPANTDAYFESEIDLPTVYRTLRDVVARVSGNEAADTFDAQLKKSGTDAALSVYTFFNGLKGRAVVVARFEEEQTLQVPLQSGQPFNFPGLSLLIGLDGVAPVFEPALKKSPAFRATQVGAMTLYEPIQPSPLKGIQPVLAVSGDTLYAGTSPQFLQECLAAGSTGLAQRPEFIEALNRVGAEGNGLVYANPRFFQQLARIEELNPYAPQQTRQMLSLIMRALPKPDRPLVSVRRNLPDGILLNSYWNRSLKQDVVMLSVYNPVTVGMLAAMAIPAFEKVRLASQEKAILNNLRMLSAAADQYYLENGVTAAIYDDLVGPDKYIRELTPVCDEVYSALIFKSGTPLRLRVPALKKVLQY